MTSENPQRADIVIIGGGVMGVSTAYHLAKLGRSDILLLEQGRLSCGTTWHAAGLVGQLRSSKNMTSMISYSAGLYSGLEAETGLATGWRQCGSVQVARTLERLEVLRRNVARAEEFGIEAELVSAERAGELWPRMTTDDLLGAVWVPSDGKVNPSDLTSSLAKGARRRGVTIAEQVTVTEVEMRKGRAAAVITDQGRIECDTVVICAGQWSKSVGRMAGVSVPLHSAEHFYAVTEPIEGVHPDLPVLRDPDGYIYFKEEVGGLVMGGFEPQAKPWLGPYDLPDKFEFALLPEDLEQVAVLMESALQRVPAMAEVGIRKFYNGPESFTPDGSPVLGRSPEVPNIFVGAGFNSAGIASAGGAGLALAEWIVEGRPTTDLRAADIRRFSRHDDNERYLRSRVMETLGMHYAMPWPNRQFDSARPLRRSAVHHRQHAAGACFSSTAGWEVPYFYGAPGSEPKLTYSFRREPWFDCAEREQLAASQSAALFDHSACAVFALKGPDSSDVLNWLCASEIHLVIGGSTRSLMLNEQGGCESEVFLVRLAEDEYLIMTGPDRATSDRDHIQRQMPPNARAVLFDCTGQYSSFTLLGPATDEILRPLTSHPACLSAGGRCELGLTTAWVSERVLGDLTGRQLLVTTDLAVSLFESLLESGAPAGLRLAGSAAWDALRIEAGVPIWGRELTPGMTAVEAGLATVTELHRDVDFCGRSALETLAEADVPHRLTVFRLRDPAPVLWGGESVLVDDRRVGRLTSGAYAARSGASVGLGYVDRPGACVDGEHALGRVYEIEVMGARVPAEIVKQATGEAEQ